MDYQYAPNETPFYPLESISLGSQFRGPTKNYVLTLPKTWIKANEKPAGGWEQRNVSIKKIMETARYITEEEIFGLGKVERRGLMRWMLLEMRMDYISRELVGTEACYIFVQIVNLEVCQLHGESFLTEIEYIAHMCSDILFTFRLKFKASFKHPTW
jgi:hypothetical protein